MSDKRRFKFYNFFGQFPEEYKDKMEFISEKTYRPKISILKRMIDKEFRHLKEVESN